MRMIARRWTGRARGTDQAAAYVTHFEIAVRPELESTEGFLGATVEQVQHGDEVEIVVVTRWESMDAISAFAGEQTDLAVVAPEARAALSEVDERVRHIELADGQVFDHLQVIDIPAEAASHEPWFNETLVDIEGSDTLTLGPHQACSVPRGVVHRTRATRRTTILMVEAAGIMPVGD
jgi:heme-degrading monooxygenase HmoA